MSKVGIEDLLAVHATKSEPAGLVATQNEKLEQESARILLDETVVSMIPFEDFELIHTFHNPLH